MNLLNNILSGTQTISISNLLLILTSSIILGLVISAVYMLEHKKTGYSPDFIITLVMIPCIISVIILVVGDSVASAFSLAGAFSLIRFRSAPGGPKDIAYVFFTVAIGLVCGMGHIFYAALFTVFLSLIMIVLNALKFGISRQHNMALKITVPENLNFSGLFDDVLNKYTKSWTMKRVKTSEFGALFEVIFDISFNENMQEKDFLDELRCLNGNLNIALTLSDSEDKSFAL